MTSQTRRTVVVAIAIAGGLAAVLAGYRWRAELSHLPFVGDWFGSINDPAMVATGARAHDPDAPPPSGVPADVRAPVDLDLRRRQLIGVQTAVAERRTLSSTIRTVGLVTYDETRLTDVNLRIEGWVRDLYVDKTGQSVSAGDVMFSVYSPDVLATQQEYVLARQARDRLSQSALPEIRRQADRLVETARRRIELWDLPADEVARLEATGEAATSVTFRSPAAGYVIDKAVVSGQHVSPGQMLYRIADLSRVWIEADVYEQDLRHVQPNVAASVSLEAYPGERFPARVSYVYPYVAADTRTVKVRVELANPGGRLKPGMYAHVELEAPLGESVAIPADALVDSGAQQLVFVAEGDGHFSPRGVTAGQRLGDLVQVLSGLEPGERVAMSGTFFLDSESQLRAAARTFAPGPTPDATDNAANADALRITLRSVPDPPQVGETTFEASVQNAAGQPVAGADVSIVLFMPAMPSMNMPAMRSAVALTGIGDGRYRGTGQVLMAGRWDATVTVTRDGQAIGTRQFPLVAR